MTVEIQIPKIAFGRIWAMKEKITAAQLKAKASKMGISVEISKGRTRDDNGEIELMAPDGFQIEPDLHVLVTIQQVNESAGGMEPWQNVINAAWRDLDSIRLPLRKCPQDCGCKE